MNEMLGSFVILRVTGGKVTAIGASSETILGDVAADTEARSVSARSPGATFVVAQVLAEYSVEPSVVVKHLPQAARVTEIGKRGRNA